MGSVDVQDELVNGAGWVRGRNTMGSVDVQDELVNGAEWDCRR